MCADWILMYSRNHAAHANRQLGFIETRGCQQSGFSLLELIVVITIASILIGLAIPSMRSYLQDAQRAQISTGLYLALNQARSEAVSRNVEIVVKANGGDWNNGWLAFEDRDGNGSPDGGQEPLFESDPINDSLQFEEDGGAALVRFTSSGRTTAPAEFTLCSAQPHNSRRLNAELSGRLTLTDLSNLTESQFNAACPSS